MIRKFGLLKMSYPNRLLVSIDFVTRHAQNYFSMHAICNTDQNDILHV